LAAACCDCKRCENQLLLIKSTFLGSSTAPSVISGMTSPGSLSTLFNSTTCSRKGLCPVTRIRNQVETFESHSLYYEIHGNGPEKLVFIMGLVTLPVDFEPAPKAFDRLNSSCFAWLAQVQHFGPLPNYSMLVFDNRFFIPPTHM
jgi:hypothetical protein